MHLSFYTLFRIYAFSTNMILLYFAFVPARRVERVIDELCSGGGDESGTATCGTAPPSPMTRRLRLLTVSTLTLAVLAVGIAQRFERKEAKLDARLPSIALLHSAFDDEVRKRKQRPADHKEREMQRWSP